VIRIATIEREFASEGRFCRVEFAIRTSGKMEAKEFLLSLKESSDFHGKGELVERKFKVLFQQMANAGRVRKKSQFSQEDGKIYAFKYELFNQLIRIPCFSHGRSWVLTHGFFKPGAQSGKGKWRSEVIDKANQIMREHIKRFPV
jgi:hypothetical protein